MPPGEPVTLGKLFKLSSLVALEHVRSSQKWSEVKWSEVKVAQSSLTLCDPMDCSLPGSSVHGTLQARILEWTDIPLIKPVSPALAGRFLTTGPLGNIQYRALQKSPMLVCPRLLPSLYWIVLVWVGVYGPSCTVQGGEGLRILTENPVCWETF